MIRKEYDKRVLRTMTVFYCKHRHGSDSLCCECRSLIEYCNSKVEKCPFGTRKRSCKVCKVHCYDSEHREKIREVMRYSGPRFLLYHPIMAIRHLLKELF
jgi:hypothetical protein